MGDFNVIKNKIAKEAEAACTEYDYYFVQAFKNAPAQWAEQLGKVKDSAKLIQRWNVPLSTAEFSKWTGTSKFRTLSEKFFDLEIQKWNDGVMEDADKVACEDFMGFADEPDVMAMEAKRQVSILVAAALANGENVDCWDGVPFFIDTEDHPYNMFDEDLGKYKNFFKGLAFNETNLITILNDIRTRKAPNGKSLGLKGTHLLVPSDLGEIARITIESQLGFGGAGATNPVYKRLEVVECPELPDSVAWYVVDARPGLEPWVIATQNGGAPETQVLGTNTHWYLDSGKVGFSAKLRLAARLAMPQAITKVQVAP